MNTTQPIYHQKEQEERIKYAFNYWYTLSEKHQNDILDSVDW